MTKQSRKELLKQEDAFIVAAGQATTWFTKHRNVVLGTAGALFVASVIAIGVSAYGNSKSKDASVYFAEGWRLSEGRVKELEEKEKARRAKERAMRGEDEGAEDEKGTDAKASADEEKGTESEKGAKHAKGKDAAAKATKGATAKATKGDKDKAATAQGADANGTTTAANEDEPADDEGDKEEEEDDRPLFATAKEKWAAARTAFEEAVKVAGHKGVGVMAALMVADLSDKLEEHEKAEQLFGNLRREVPADDNLSFLAVERYAYAREAAGDTEGAIDALKDLAADEQRFYADYAQLHQARLYLAKGDHDKARSMLEHLQSAFPESSAQEEVKSKLAELGGDSMAQLGKGTTPVDTNGRIGQ